MGRAIPAGRRTDGLHIPQAASSYPLHIYPRWIRGLLTFVLPITFVNCMPVRYSAGRGGGPADLLLPPVVAGLLLLAASLFWRRGEQRYQSTGS